MQNRWQPLWSEWVDKALLLTEKTSDVFPQSVCSCVSIAMSSIAKNRYTTESFWENNIIRKLYM